MIAYKGFQKDLKCRGFQFQEYGINETEKANCRQNGFHCAENPLDCLCYYPNWKNSVYYIVDASGDLDGRWRRFKNLLHKDAPVKEN